MSKVQVIATIPASPQAVWDVLGDFGAIAKWHPAVAESLAEGTGPGALRRLTLVNGDRLVERLEEFNDGERYYSYSLVEGPLPVCDYYATLHVRAAYDAPSSTIEWTGAFTAKDVPHQSLDEKRRFDLELTQIAKDEVNPEAAAADAANEVEEEKKAEEEGEPKAEVEKA